MLEQINESLTKLQTKLEGWLTDFIVWLPNILIAALVMLVGYLLTGYVRRGIDRMLGRFVKTKSVRSLLTSALTALFVVAVLFLVLSVLNLDTVLTSLLAGAGVVGLAVGLAFQEPIMNLFSGIMMATKDIFEVGDLVETNDYFGHIHKIGLRHTIIMTPEGQEVMLPNKDIYHEPIKNFSVTKRRRIDLECGVSYGDDLEKVKRVAIQAIQDKVKYDDDKEVELFFNGFGDSSINFELRFWLSQPSLRDYLQARSEAIVALKAAFDAEDIMIPFPIRTLDFGIKGGEKLDAMLQAQKSSNGVHQ